MIWQFEQGPWDGWSIEVHGDMLVPMTQVMSVWGDPACTYELAHKEDPDTFVYRPAMATGGPMRWVPPGRRALDA
jgi:hypothetical protein